MQRLVGRAQHYAWGSVDAIPALLGDEPTGEPVAELWFGAHPMSPSTIQGDGAPIDLDRWIARDPVAALGADVSERFEGALPYLVKILAAARPLSLQMHPDAATARAGFAREEAAGIDRRAPERLYRDPFPKPELIVALTPFEALCGFRVAEDCLDLLTGLASAGPVADLAAVVESDGSSAAVAWALGLDRSAAASLVGAMAEGAGSGGDGRFADERRWLARLAEAYPGDPGVAVAALLHHVRLAPGQAVFLGPGRLHSYLGGLGVEVMANSDNVVRGGLTPKHVDVAELCALLDPAPHEVEVQTPVAGRHRYAVAADSFSVERIEVAGPVELDVGGPEILVCVSGAVTARSPRSAAGLDLGPGQAAWVPADEGSHHLDGAGLVYRATT